MSKISKVFRTLRNHWKKSVFFTGLAIWGANFGHGRYLEFNLMKAYCQEALKYGEERIAPSDRVRHVTVLLNPVANKRKGKADYEKYCAPLFHLAGLKVSLVVIEAEGQVKDLMGIMDNTDCVVLAGGDGTVHEAINGLLRREDSQNASKKFPIGILPIGKNNFIAYKLNCSIYDPKKDMKAKILAESSMAVIRQTLNKVDVIKIEGERGRPVYSLGSLNMGQLQYVIRKVDQYWYFGQRMKPYLAFFFHSFKDLSPKWEENKEILIEYTKPCSGCSKCYQKYEQNLSKTIETNNAFTKRWWHSFMLPKHTSTVDLVLEAQRKLIEKMKTTINKECDQWQTMTVKSKNILIQDTLDNSIEMIIHPVDLSRSAFIDEGIRMFKNEKLDTFLKIKAKHYRIYTMFKESVTSINKKNELSPFTLVEHRFNSVKELDDNEDPNNQTDEGQNQMVEHLINKESENIENDDDDGRWISIDNENYEMQSKIEISLLPSSLQIYHGSIYSTNQG